MKIIYEAIYALSLLLIYDNVADKLEAVMEDSEQILTQYIKERQPFNVVNSNLEMSLNSMIKWQTVSTIKLMEITNNQVCVHLDIIATYYFYCPSCGEEKVHNKNTRSFDIMSLKLVGKLQSRGLCKEAQFNF